MKTQDAFYSVITDQSNHRMMYGIQAAGTGCVHRISSDLQEVESLVSRFNELELSPTHFYEAVEDYRHDFTY